MLYLIQARFWGFSTIIKVCLTVYCYILYHCTITTSWSKSSRRVNRWNLKKANLHTSPFHVLCAWKPNREHYSICLLENVSLLISLKVIKHYYIDDGWLECGGNSSNRQLKPGRCPELVHRIYIYFAWHEALTISKWIVYHISLSNPFAICISEGGLA